MRAVLNQRQHDRVTAEMKLANVCGAFASNAALATKRCKSRIHHYNHYHSAHRFHHFLQFSPNRTILDAGSVKKVADYHSEMPNLIVIIPFVVHDIGSVTVGVIGK